MRLVTRYLLAELLKVFSVALAGMTLLLILVGVLQEAVTQNLGPMTVLRIVPYVLPDALRFAVPGTVLFSACSVFGRLSANNEVLAIKAAGVSAMAVIGPALVFSFLLSLVAVWLNDVAVSWGRQNTQRIIIHSVEQIAYGTLRTRGAYGTDRFSISVRGVDGDTLLRPTLTVHGSGDEPPLVVAAREATLRFNPSRESLRILLTDAEVTFGTAQLVVPDETFEYEIPLKADRPSRSPSRYALHEIAEEVQRQRATLAEHEQRIAAEAACQLLTGDFAALAGAAWQARLDDLQYQRTRLFRLETEPWRRWANGFSCFFFVLVGAPLAIRLRHADVWTTFGMCFLPILIVYYVPMMYGIDRAKTGALPPYSVWMGNLLLLAVGLLLLRHVRRF